ncbi:formate dehydrogenase subunit gamma [Desulfuribacillus alkaliarsenatis]|uniref:Formate dehydrogenase subunit gamma n=1 Tax=Desulfuribacillus alkaliarsenatis TaxID=766136 RepID=A0A1E5FZK1_9FIRM|nr:formate dehydrogenase subunit gamma [Desulfuribacillus alkaliarsenatis]OEF95922.1 formate dehydrogenase subunit gamma [Desulfuribacillus alkaliarsenatis]
MAKETPMVKDGKIYRFTKTARVTHWVYVISYAVLFFTGLLLFSNAFDFIAPLFGGFENAQLLHRIFAVVFILPVVIFILFDPKSFFGWLKDCFTWTKDDFGFFPSFVKELFGIDAKTPPQGFINAGEKVNSLMTITFSTLLILSGFVMWFSGSFSQVLVQWAIVIHSGSAALLTAVAIVHIYLGTLHPGSKAAFTGMINGYVDAKFAKSHHAKWYDKVMEEESKKTKTI